MFLEIVLQRDLQHHRTLGVLGQYEGPSLVEIVEIVVQRRVNVRVPLPMLKRQQLLGTLPVDRKEVALPVIGLVEVHQILKEQRHAASHSRSVRWLARQGSGRCAPWDRRRMYRPPYPCSRASVPSCLCLNNRWECAQDLLLDIAPFRFTLLIVLSSILYFGF